MPRPEDLRPQLESLLHPLVAADPRMGAVLGAISADVPEGALVHAGRFAPTEEGIALPPLEATPFELASVSKSFTAALFEILSHRLPGLADARLGDLRFPGVPRVSERIAHIPLRSIITFTSGLPVDNVYPSNDPPDRILFPNRQHTPETLFRYAADVPFPVDPPGEKYTYSCFGYALLSELLALVDGGGSFADVLRRHLLSPLGLDATGVLDEDAELRMPLCLDKNGAPIPPGSGGFPAHYGSAGLVSAPRDLMQWLRFHLGLLPDHPLSALLPRLHAEATHLRTPAGLTSAFGWFLRDMPAPGGAIPIVLKGGGLDGFMTWIGFDKSSNPGVVPSSGGVFVLTNFPCDIRMVGQQALLALRGQAPKDP